MVIFEWNALVGGGWEGALLLKRLEADMFDIYDLKHFSKTIEAKQSF